MDQAIQPIGDKPLLVRRGATFTRIIVNQVQDAEGEMYHVMFIGTGACGQGCIGAAQSHFLYIFHIAAFANLTTSVVSIGPYVSACKYSMFFMFLYEKSKAQC